MSVIRVNSFTSQILNQLYACQNDTGNKAFSGLNLYILMGAINLGLKGRSFFKLSHYLDDVYGELYTDNWMVTRSADTWLFLKKLLRKLSISESALFYSCDIYQQYRKISNLIFDINKIKVNFSDSAETARKMNQWIYRQTYGSITNIFGESTLNDNSLIFISALFYRVCWETNFKSSLTKDEIFVDDKGRNMVVSMMNQEGYERIYDSIGDNFIILFKTLDNPEYISAIVLPREGHSIHEVMKNFDLDQMYTCLHVSSLRRVKVKLPKFKILSRNDIFETCKNLPIIDIFHPNHSDHGRITKQDVFISKIMLVINVLADDVNVSVPDTDTMDRETDTDTYKFYATRPFLFFSFSALQRLILISAVVTNPNAA